MRHVAELSTSFQSLVDLNIYKFSFIRRDISIAHDDVIKWKHFPRDWPFVRRISSVPVNSAHKGQWRGALMFSLICTWINCWVNNLKAADLRRYRAHYDVIVMKRSVCVFFCGMLTDTIHQGASRLPCKPPANLIWNVLIEFISLK